MARKLTDEEIDARMVAYDEAIVHIQEMNWYDTEIERVQGLAVGEEIRKAMERFFAGKQYRYKKK